MQPQCQGHQWNPYAGTKPSWLDDFASDGELEMEDELPYRGAIDKKNNPMVRLIADLGDDSKWLPWKEQMKRDARITGKGVCYQSQDIENTY